MGLCWRFPRTFASSAMRVRNGCQGSSAVAAAAGWRKVAIAAAMAPPKFLSGQHGRARPARKDRTRLVEMRDSHGQRRNGRRQSRAALCTVVNQDSCGVLGPARPTVVAYNRSRMRRDGASMVRCCALKREARPRYRLRIRLGRANHAAAREPRHHVGRATPCRAPYATAEAASSDDNARLDRSRLPSMWSRCSRLHTIQIKKTDRCAHGHALERPKGGASAGARCPPRCTARRRSEFERGCEPTTPPRERSTAATR